MSSGSDDVGPPRQPEAAFALISLVTGIVGLVGVLLVFPVIFMILGAFAVTTGLRGRHGNVRQRMAVTGAVLGALAVVVALALIFFGPEVPVPAA